MTAAGAFLVIRKLNFQGAVYRYFIKPLAAASFGTYLAHMLVLVPVLAWIRPHFPTPVTMVLSSVATFVLTSIVSIVLGRIPFLGRFIAP
jgi:surface polysaccharide O-acyltransferase-like enzyme